MSVGKVWFVGAGPGDPDLITVKGRDLITRAGAILFAGSLVSEAAMRWAPAGCEVADSKDMALEEIIAWLIARAQTSAVVLRLQTGDPSLYGALIEMAQPLDAAGVDIGVVPGVTSAMASAAAAVESLTLPEVTQTVILTRVEGRTPMPAGESLEELARHHCTLCVYLSITLLQRVVGALRAAGWRDDAPMLVVHKASWPGEEKDHSRLHRRHPRQVPRGQDQQPGDDHRQPGARRARVAGSEEIETLRRNVHAPLPARIGVRHMENSHGELAWIARMDNSHG
jgi:precorrin-4/cobalt-precorrin-4 C11-methyltransferase